MKGTRRFNAVQSSNKSIDKKMELIKKSEFKERKRCSVEEID